jgi:hypothetical protein
MRIGTLAIAIGLAAVLAGCGQGKHEQTVTIKDKGGNVTVSANGEHVIMHSDNGKATVEVNTNGVSVSGLPPFIAVYPGAKVVTSATGTDTSGAGGTLIMEAAKAAPADVVGFYKKRAEGAGFKETMNMNMSGQVMYAAQSGDETVQVIAAKTDDGAHAQVNWARK